MSIKKKYIIISIIIIVLLGIGTAISFINKNQINDLSKIEVGQVYIPQEENIKIDEETGIKYINNEIMIMFNSDVSKKEKNKIIDEINGKIIGIIDEEWDCIQVEVSERSYEELNSLIKELQNKEEVFGAMTDTVLNLTNNSTSVLAR